jgi:hypothetical protein
MTAMVELDDLSKLGELARSRGLLIQRVTDTEKELVISRGLFERREAELADLKKKLAETEAHMLGIARKL